MVSEADEVRSTRERWVVGPSEVDAEGVLGAAALVSRATTVASSLIDRSQVTAVSIDELTLLSPVRVGVTLVITAALEHDAGDDQVVSVVVRRGEVGARGGVAALGVLKFARLRNRRSLGASVSASLLHTARQGASVGATPVESTFRSEAGPTALANGLLLGRVYELALVSAQGFAGAPAVLASVQSLSVLAPLRQGQALRVQCSVVHAEGTRVTVLSHVVDDDTDRDVLCALTSFRSSQAVSRVRAVTDDGRVLTGEFARMRVQQAS